MDGPSRALRVLRGERELVRHSTDLGNVKGASFRFACELVDRVNQHGTFGLIGLCRNLPPWASTVLLAGWRA